MVDREKVIKGLMHCTAWSGLHECQPKVGDDCPYEDDADCQLSLMRDALVLLKEQEARVLTTDELFYMEHQGVYIERRNSQLYATEPAIVLRTAVCEPSFGGTKYILMRENKLSESRWACDYNKDRRNGWRCWTSKPTEEQRKAVKWG